MTKLDNAVEFIASLEAFKADAYPDSGNVITIGFGTTYYPDGSKVKLGDKCTLEEAKHFLLYHLNKYVFLVLNKIYIFTIPIYDKLYVSLSAFIYNIGHLPPPMFDHIANKAWVALILEWRQYDKINGEFCRGLYNRRTKEIDYFKASLVPNIQAG